MPLKIALVGAGPGGCMLARLLHTHNITTTIFEAEASLNYRSQGGTLDLRANTGLAAIKLAGLWDDYQKYARYDGESLLITDKNLTTWVRRDGGKKEAGKRAPKAGDMPEIDRADLRKILMESLPEDVIRWGHKLSRVEQTLSGLSLHFAHGEVHNGFDLIVGCDGAFSKARTLLTSERPYYTGLGGWVMDIPDARDSAPEVYKLVNRGSVFAYSDGKSLSLQQLADESIQISSYGHYLEDYTQTCGFDAQHDLDAVKTALKNALHGWRPELVEAIEKAARGLTWRNLYQLPVGFTWEHRAGITLLGDAAHVMTPFAGIGVNTAFWDAMLLAKQIVAYTDATNTGGAAAELENGQMEALDPYIVAYGRAMFEHAHAAQGRTEGAKNDMLFTPGAPRTSIERWLLRHAKEEVPAWCRPLLTAIVYAGYWVYKLFV